MAFGIVPPFELNFTPAYHKDASDHEYYGWAQKGTIHTDAKWKIVKIEYTTGNWVMKYAEGNADFAHQWSNVESLNYYYLGTTT